MKRLRTKLSLHRQTLRALSPELLRRADGGLIDGTPYCTRRGSGCSTYADSLCCNQTDVGCKTYDNCPVNM